MFKDVLYAVGHVPNAIAVQIEPVVVAPVISGERTIPAVVGVASNDLEWAEVLDDVILFKQIVNGTREDLQGEVIAGQEIVPQRASGQSLHEDANRVVRNDVLFRDAIVVGLKQDAVGSEAAVVQKGVVPETNPLGIHDGGASNIVVKQVPLKIVVVRIHVMEAVPQVVDPVVADPAVIGILQVHAITSLKDRVSFECIITGIPDMDSTAAVAQIMQRSPLDGVANDVVVIGVQQIDSEKHVAQVVILDLIVAGFEKNAGVFVYQHPSTVLDYKSAHHTMVRSHCNHARLAGTVNHRLTDTHKLHPVIEKHILVVGSRTDLNGVAGNRSSHSF